MLCSLIPKSIIVTHNLVTSRAFPQRNGVTCTIFSSRVGLRVFPLTHLLIINWPCSLLSCNSFATNIDYKVNKENDLEVFWERGQEGSFLIQNALQNQFGMEHILAHICIDKE